MRHRLNCTTKVVHPVPSSRTTTPRAAIYSVSPCYYRIRADVIAKAKNWYVVSLMYLSAEYSEQCMKNVLSYICLEVEDSLSKIKREFIDHSCNPIE